MQATVTAICEAAAGFSDHFDGKVQKYLRHYGELMLRQLSESFSFSGLDQAAVRHAFALWFQNVLNMPLPMPDRIAHEACEMLGVEYEPLVKAADDVGVNVALLDNVLRAYWQKEIEMGAPE